MKGGAFAILAVFLLASVLLFGCAGNAGQNAQKKTIKVSGAFALYPLVVKWAEEYQKINSGARIDVSAGGAGKGMTDTLSGVVDIGMISRDIDDAEIAKGAYPVKVATDAVVVIANAKNLAAEEIAKSGAAKAKLKELFADGKEATWSEIAGANDAKVQVYRRSDSCGASDTFAKYLGITSDELKGIGVFGDPGIVEAIAKDKNGIGYANLNFAYDMKTGKPNEGIIAVPLEGTGAEIYASKAGIDGAIANKKYPFPPARDLYIVGKGKFDGETQKFVLWALTDGQKFVEETGYVKLDNDVLSAQVEKVS